MKTNLRKKNTEIKYRFADLKEAQTLYLSNTEYFKNLTPFELEYKLNKKNATLEEYKTFGVSQMLEFTDNEKKKHTFNMGKVYLIISSSLHIYIKK